MIVNKQGGREREQCMDAEGGVLCAGGGSRIVTAEGDNFAQEWQGANANARTRRGMMA